MGASSKLRKTEEPFEPVRLLAALDACAQSLVVLENGRLLCANRAFRKEAGIVSSSDLRSRLLTGLVQQDPGHLDQWNGVSSLTRDQEQIEASLPHLQTSESTFEVICTPKIQQLKICDAPLRQLKASEAVRLVSSEIAHDFGNLVTTILLYTDLLIAGLESNARLRRYAEAVRRAGESGVLLVKELTSPFLEEVAAPPLSWNQVVSDKRTLLTRWVGETIGIQTRFAETLGYVKIDANRHTRLF